MTPPRSFLSPPVPVAAAAAAARARALRGQQAGVLNRRQIVRAGIPRWFVRNEVARGRWQRRGRHVVVLHNGPLSLVQLRWAAVLEVGPRAALDGVTALQDAGLRGLDDVVIHVSAPKGSKPGRMKGAIVHETRRFREADVDDRKGVRRMRPAVAAVHAALWARTDREATLFVVMTVQQRLASVTEVADVLKSVKRHRRRGMLTAVLAEVAAGSQSLGELDVVGGLRRRSLPIPSRQSLRRRPNGDEYLDCEFDEFALVLEIDGAGHELAEQALGDVLRDLTLFVERRYVIRISLLAWALDQDAVLDGLETAFRSRGWRPLAA